jgi:hypothetical protein
MPQDPGTDPITHHVGSAAAWLQYAITECAGVLTLDDTRALVRDYARLEAAYRALVAHVQTLQRDTEIQLQIHHGPVARAPSADEAPQGRPPSQ